MKKTVNKLAINILVSLILAFGGFLNAHALSDLPDTLPTQNQFIRTFTTINAQGLVQELSGSVESITVEDGLWTVTAGGVSAFTHYARLRYKLPEQEGISPTTFYMKSVVILPPDFYTKQTAGFRIMSTDNFGTTVNGVHYGASDINELRTAVWFFSDHKIRIRTEHETVSKELLYTAPTQLPVGEHVFEFYGDVANVAPWWFRIDGIVVASGNARLSPDSVPVEERVITRLTTGIMGAADLNYNSMTLQVREFTVANYDPYAATVTPTIAPSVPPPVTPTVTESGMPTPTNSFLPTITQTTIPPTTTSTGIIATTTNVTPTPLPQTPIVTPTFTAIPPTLPGGISVLTSVDPDTLLVGETGLVSVSLNGLSAEGIASVEFTCSYASDQISVGSVQIGEIFGNDPVAAYNNSQTGSFIYVVAASNGKVINTNGMAFTFNITGLQPGSSSVECKANIIKANYSMESIASIPDSLTIIPLTAPTATPLSAPMLTGQVIAKKPVTISLLNPDTTLAAAAITNPDGSFNLVAPAGSFTVVASAEGHLNAQTSVTLLDGTTTTLAPLTLPAGDIDSNNVIDQYDALTVGMNYNVSASLPADLSNDGLINAVDLVMLAENYRLTGLIPWQPP